MKRDKLALPFGGSSILASIVGRFSECFDAVYLSVADPEKYPEINGKRLVDIYKGCGPMAGLHAALRETREDGVFLVAADLPFADPKAALRLIELAGDSDVCITTDARSRFEPLFGYYKKAILPAVESNLKAGDYKLALLLNHVRLRVVSARELEEFPMERILLNINYPEDYEKLIGQ